MSLRIDRENGAGTGLRGLSLPRPLRITINLIVTVALTFLGLLFVTFIIGRVVPIDPVLAIVGDRAPEHVVERVRIELGLDLPLYQQFAIYVWNVLQGDLGNSVLTANPVLEDISVTLPQGAIIGITAANDEDRRALAEVLTRETLPTSGTVALANRVNPPVGPVRSVGSVSAVS